MGAGKSTIGRMLADRLHYRFVDTDRDLMREFGKSISRIFSEDGEEAFRAAEEALLEDLSCQGQIVVSLGGGTLSRPANAELAMDTGLVVYLKAPIEVLYERVIFSRKDRPMLNVPDSEAVFKERFESRRTIYEGAHVTVETHQRQSHQVVEEIIEKMEKLEALSS